MGVNVSHALILSLMGLFALFLSIPYFEASGHRVGSTFDCATSVLGETGGACRGGQAVQAASSKPAANDFLRPGDESMLR